MNPRKIAFKHSTSAHQEEGRIRFMSFRNLVLGVVVGIKLMKSSSLDG